MPRTLSGLWDITSDLIAVVGGGVAVVRRSAAAFWAAWVGLRLGWVRWFAEEWRGRIAAVRVEEASPLRPQRRWGLAG